MSRGSIKVLSEPSIICAERITSKLSGVSINRLPVFKVAVAYLLLLSESTSLKILNSASSINPLIIVELNTFESFDTISLGTI